MATIPPDLMDKLADSRAILESALLRLPDSDYELKETVRTTILQIDFVRLKVLRLAVDEDWP
jgi:hypothetical protein